jgi:hypothetical protein
VMSPGMGVAIEASGDRARGGDGDSGGRHPLERNRTDLNVS